MIDRRPRRVATVLTAFVVAAFLVAAVAVATSRLPLAATARSLPPRAPAFHARLLGSARTVTLRSLAGRPALLDFWASWCPPCQSELRDVARVARAGTEGATVLGVDVRDTAGAARSALRRAGADYPQVTDPDGLVAGDFRVVGTPTVVVLDARGRVVGRVLGPAGAARLERLLRVAAADDVVSGPNGAERPSSVPRRLPLPLAEPGPSST